MRFYSGFLLLEDVFDNLPGVLTEIDIFADSIFNPTLLIASADCGTQLGTIKKVDFKLEGSTELATGLVISLDRIKTLLMDGIYTISTRDIHSCIEPGGICVACYSAAFPEDLYPHFNFLQPDPPLPVPGIRIKIISDYIVSTDIFVGNGVSTTFPLSLTPDEYTELLVYYGGVLQKPQLIHFHADPGYTISETTLTLPFAPAVNTTLVVHFKLHSAKPFFGYLSKTYTGGLLGVKSLPTEPLIVRPSLIYSLISEGQLNRVKTLLATFTTIESTYYNYIDAIPDNLEKALYMIMLYGIYGNVNL